MHSWVSFYGSYQGHIELPKAARYTLGLTSIGQKETNSVRMKEWEATKHRGKIYTKINVVPTPISGSFTGYPGMMTRALDLEA